MPARPVSRRTVLAGLAGTAGAASVGALAGCTAGETGDRATPTQESDPDVALVGEALAAQVAILALVDSVAADVPRRVRLLAATKSTHLVHEQLLAQALPESAGDPPRGGSTTRPPAFPGDDPAAFLALARAESRLARTLRQAAFRARSGAFARVLAGMAAGCAQQEVHLRGLAAR